MNPSEPAKHCQFHIHLTPARLEWNGQALCHACYRDAAHASLPAALTDKDRAPHGVIDSWRP